MAKILSNNGIITGLPVEAHHVSQSVNALTAAEAYDINISGSLTVNGVKYPIVDGTANQVLLTDGAGTATFQDNNAVSASYISSSNVDGPFGLDSILTASYALSASYSAFAQEASSSLFAIRALSAESATSSSYAATASYVDSIGSEKYDFVLETSLNVVHGLGSENVVVQVYEETGSLDPVQFIPDLIEIDSKDQITLGFAEPTTGYVVIAGGGFLRSGSIETAKSASYAARTSNTLTNGVGIQSFSFNGSTDQIVAFDDNYTVPSSSYALTASFALNVPENVDTASYVSSSNVDGPHGFDSIQTSSYALTASYIDLTDTKRFDFTNVSTLFVPHNLDSENVFIQVYQEDATTGNIPTKIVPSSIQLLNNNL